MLVTPGMVIEVRAEQRKNASSPMLVTELGSVMDVSVVQPFSAPVGMAWTPSGTTTLLVQVGVQEVATAVDSSIALNAHHAAAAGGRPFAHQHPL